MIRTLATASAWLCFSSWAVGAIYTEIPPAGPEKTPTQAVEYDVTPFEGGEILDIDVSNIFSYNLQGSIPPNETRVIDVAAEVGNSGQPYRVVGLGWDVELDAFQPSWLSDISVAFGDDPTYADPDLLLSPAMGNDFAGLANFSSNGLVDLTTNGPGGSDISFELSQGQLYLEFFEVFDDFGNGPIPDGQWRPNSSLTIQVIAVPEPVRLAWLGAAWVSAWILRRTRPAAS